MRQIIKLLIFFQFVFNFAEAKMPPAPLGLYGRVGRFDFGREKLTGDCRESGRARGELGESPSLVYSGERVVGIGSGSSSCCCG